MNRYLKQHLPLTILSISLSCNYYIVPQAAAAEGIDKLMIQIQMESCQLLNQGYSIPDVVSNIKPIVKRFDPNYLAAYAKNAREVLNENGTDIDITTRRIIYGPIKRNCPQHLDKLIEYNRNNLSLSSSGQIVDGLYNYESSTSDDTFFLDVKGNQYRIFNSSDFGNVSNVPLRPLSELKFVRSGILYIPNSDVLKYWCSNKAPNYKKPRRPTEKYYCTPEGWSSSPYSVTPVTPSKANPAQPPVRLNNQKFEPESPKILLSANISSSEAQVLEKLNSVPVFIIADATGKPLFGKNDTQVVYFFLNPDDATAYLNWIKNTNPEPSDNARIIARSLTEAYQTIKKNQDRKDITFQITPSKSSLDSAREILPSQGKFANKLPNIPVFFATGNTNRTNGLLTLTIDGKQTVPYFFDLKDLQSLLNKAMQAQPNVSNSTKIQVTSLYYVLDLMVDAKNGKPNPETERFEFVPSRSAFEYAVQKGSSK